VFLIIGPITASLTSFYPDKATFEKSPAQGKNSHADIADRIKDFHSKEGQGPLALVS
jgi:hypothetical protein